MIIKPIAITGPDASHQWEHAMKIGEIFDVKSPLVSEFYYTIVTDYFDLLARYEPERLKT